MKKAFKTFWNKNKYFITALLFCACLLLVWEVSVRVKKTPDYVFPSFSACVKSTIGLFGQKSFYKKLLDTLLRFARSLALSCVLGLVFGIIGGLNPYIKACLKPIMATVKAVPVMAITLILLINFGKQDAPVVIGLLMGLPIIYSQVAFAIEGIDKSVLEMAKVFNVPLKRRLFSIYVPKATEGFLGGLSTAAGLTLKAVISAEILCYTVNSLGLSMQIARANMFTDTPLLFAYVIVAIMLSLLFDFVLKLVKRAVIRWK